MDLQPGQPFPDLELADHVGQRRRLSELIGGDPVILHFYRGWWCPKEQAYFRQLLALQDEMEIAYARCISVSVDPPEVAAAFRAGLGVRWTFLCDPDHEMVDVLGLRETTDSTNDPYTPTVFVLTPPATIHARYDGYWYWGRATMEELRRDLREVSAALRPDWKLTDP